jgi:hypothetical protein
MGVLLLGCDLTTQKYKISDDLLDRKLFEHELVKRNIKFDIDEKGFYKAVDDRFNEMVSIGESMVGSSSVSFTVDKSCSSRKFLEWLQNKQVVYVEETSGSKLSLRLRKDDSESIQAINHFAGFHFACVRAGVEDEYNELWKRSP